MFYNNINPDLISLGPFTIRFYGIVYALGFILVAYLFSKSKIKNLDKDRGYDLVAFGLIFGLIGARLFHVISDFHLYKNDLFGIFKIWQGGLGFQGGLLFAIIFGYYFSKKMNINFLQILDTAALPMPLLIGFGRIANYINSEHVGYITDVPWCIVFQRIDSVCRHPAQLYQALSQFILFGVLLLIYKKLNTHHKRSKRNSKTNKDGIIAFAFIAGYGIVRLITDFFREYDVLYYGVSHTQILSIIMIYLGLYMIYRRWKRDKN